jgi:hypothetical protein
MKVVGLLSIGQEWPTSTGGALDHVCDALGKQHCLGAMQSKIGDTIISADFADGVQRSADDVRAGARDQLDARRGPLEESVRLCSGIL